jgi:hypothetical protein
VSLFKSAPVLDCVRGHLDALLPDRMTVGIEVDSATDGTVAISPVTSPTQQYFRMGGPDKARMLIQVDVKDTTRARVRLTGDQIREFLAGVNHRGQPLHPLVLPDYTFDVPKTTGDGHAVTSNGSHTWVETFELVWQYRPSE